MLAFRESNAVEGAGRSGQGFWGSTGLRRLKMKMNLSSKELELIMAALEYIRDLSEASKKEKLEVKKLLAKLEKGK